MVRRAAQNLLAIVAREEPPLMVDGLTEKSVVRTGSARYTGIGDDRRVGEAVAVPDEELDDASPDRFPEGRCGAASPA